MFIDIPNDVLIKFLRDQQPQAAVKKFCIDYNSANGCELPSQHGNTEKELNMNKKNVAHFCSICDSITGLQMCHPATMCVFRESTTIIKTCLPYWEFLREQKIQERVKMAKNKQFKGRSFYKYGTMDNQ